MRLSPEDSVVMPCEIAIDSKNAPAKWVEYIFHNLDRWYICQFSGWKIWSLFVHDRHGYNVKSVLNVLLFYDTITAN